MHIERVSRRAGRAGIYTERVSRRGRVYTPSGSVGGGLLVYIADRPVGGRPRRILIVQVTQPAGMSWGG